MPSKYIAWTPAQLALMQDGLNAKLTYAETAAKVKTEHKLQVTKNVIAGLVKRQTLKVHPDGTVCSRGSRVSVAVMKQRLALIREAFGGGITTIEAIANQAGISYEQARRGLNKLGLKVTPPYKTPSMAGSYGKQRRSKERRPQTKRDPDQVADIGIRFIALQANSCRYPIARDPQDNTQRFCGEPRMMRGPYFSSSYCCEHHVRCHRIQYMEAAE